VRDGDDFIITGHKSWTSRIDESDLAFVLARTSEKPEGKGSDKTHGLTLFLVDLRQVRAEQPDTLKVVKVHTMFNYATDRCSGCRRTGLVVRSSSRLQPRGSRGRPERPGFSPAPVRSAVVHQAGVEVAPPSVKPMNIVR
jgi:hypothetical protein